MELERSLRQIFNPNMYDWHGIQKLKDAMDKMYINITVVQQKMDSME